MRIAIIGAGGHGKVVADAVRARGKEILAGFLDDAAQFAGRVVAGATVLGGVATWSRHDIDGLVPAIGDNRTRRDVVLRVTAEGARLVSVVHPDVTISADARIKAGATILARAVVNIDTEIGENVIINTGAVIEHDCVIGPHVHIAPGSCLAGNVTVGEGAFLGIGSRVIPGVRIGAWAVVGAGAVVTKDVPDGATVVGVPARRLR
ncbi:MAG: acetyltransferase [Pseudomonadota bacterium]